MGKDKNLRYKLLTCALIFRPYFPMKRLFYLLFCVAFLGIAVTSCIQDSTEDASKVLTITYSNSGVRVDNPMEKYGVSIKVTGANVLVTSVYEGEDVCLNVSGESSNGSLKIYSRKRFTLGLNGLNLTNPDGPAINIQSKKHVTVNLAGGSSNVLTDGTDYPAEVLVNGIPEEQSAAFFSEGGLYFQGSGSLTLAARGVLQHAVASDDKIQVENATIEIQSSHKDGFHTNDGYTQLSGNVRIHSGGDGIDAGSSFFQMSGGVLTVETDSAGSKGVVCDSTLTVSGGTLAVTVAGDQSKGLRSGRTLTLNGGDILITASGGSVLTPLSVGYDPSYCAAIKCDADVVLNGSTLNIVHTGSAGRGISAGTDFTMLSGSLQIQTSGSGAAYLDSTGNQDATSSVCISTDRMVHLFGGTVSALSSGLGGRCISSDSCLTIGSETLSPTISLTCTGQAVTDGGVSLTESKVIKCNGSVRIQNGRVFLNAAGFGGAIDSKSSIYMAGGLLVAQGPPSGSELKTFDYNVAFEITGGTLMANGPYRASIPLPTAGSTQNYLYARASNSATYLPADAMLTLKDANSTVEFSYKPKRNAYFFLYSSPAFKQNIMYYLYAGGTNTDGTSLNGFFLDGVFSGGRLKTGFTPVRVMTSSVFTPLPL